MLQGLLKQTFRKIIEVSGDGTCNTGHYHDATQFKRADSLI